MAAGALGTIRACLEHSVSYAKKRSTFGKEIGRNQFVQEMIAKMVLNLETSRLLVLQVAWLKNHNKRDTREVSLAKWHATEAAFAAANDALQIHGNKGYSDDESPIGRYFRNARAPIIYEGTTQIHKMMQAEIEEAAGDVTLEILKEIERNTEATLKVAEALKRQRGPVGTA